MVLKSYHRFKHIHFVQISTTYFGTPKRHVVGQLVVVQKCGMIRRGNN